LACPKGVVDVENTRQAHETLSLVSVTPHPNGQWCKKIRGALHFFGVWADPDAAHAQYLRVASDLHAGRQPASVATPELPVKELGNAFLASQAERLASGQIGGRWSEEAHIAPLSIIEIVVENGVTEEQSRANVVCRRVPVAPSEEEMLVNNGFSPA
jgi:hypothetical protein